MLVTPDQVLPVLRAFNPWWASPSAADAPGLPKLRRAMFQSLMGWLQAPPAHRALQVLGMRQIGKTTLLRQAVQELVRQGTPPTHILYATFDHPFLRLSGLDAVLRLWQELVPADDQPRYLLLDEVQALPDWATHIKHLVDFQPHYRLVVTGSSIPLTTAGAESGVGRLARLPLGTLSFYEFMYLRGDPLPSLPPLESLRELAKLSAAELLGFTAAAETLTAHFHQYLLRGGFPQTAKMENLTEAQRLLREDVVDRVLKRDMTALFGVRNIAELEQLFFYLCLHDGGQLNLTQLASDLGMKRPTVSSYLELLESAHLVHRLMPFGYGKQVLRGKPKVYLADPGLAPAVLLKGMQLLEDDVAMGIAVETAVFKHLTTHYRTRDLLFSYWQNSKQQEVDFVARNGDQVTPFEVKYRRQSPDWRALRGLADFLAEAPTTDFAYVITRRAEDIGVLPVRSETRATVLQVPAALACFLLGRSEHQRALS